MGGEGEKRDEGMEGLKIDLNIPAFPHIWQNDL